MAIQKYLNSFSTYSDFSWVHKSLDNKHPAALYTSFCTCREHNTWHGYTWSLHLSTFGRSGVGKETCDSQVVEDSALPHGHALGLRVEAGAGVRHPLARCKHRDNTGLWMSEESDERFGRSLGGNGDGPPLYGWRMVFGKECLNSLTLDV